MPGEIEDILAGPDYFLCEKWRIRMRKVVCVERQEILAAGRWNSETEPVYRKCEGCGQGERVKEEVEKIRRSEDQGEEMKPTDGENVAPKDKKPLCPECGINPVTIRSDGISMGKCKTCRGRAISMAKKGKRQEQDLKEEDEKLRGLEVKKTKSTPADNMPEAWKEAGHNFDFELVGQILEEAGLLKRLVVAAENQFRLPEAQIAHYVKQGLAPATGTAGKIGD